MELADTQAFATYILLAGAHQASNQQYRKGHATSCETGRPAIQHRRDLTRGTKGDLKPLQKVVANSSSCRHRECLHTALLTCRFSTFAVSTSPPLVVRRYSRRVASTGKIALNKLSCHIVSSFWTYGPFEEGLLGSKL